MEENKINLKSIAKELGVSISTVSRVMNDKPGVGSSTRKKVLELLEKYNFALNSSAQSLKTSKTRTIALISKKREERLCSADYFQRSVVYIENGLRSRGYHTFAISIDDKEMDNPKELLMLKENRVDGFIIRGPAIKPKFILDLKNTGLPIVLFGNDLQQTELDSVVCQNRKGTYEITRHLVWHGHKKILFLTGPENWYTNSERMEGYIDALNEAGLKQHIIHMPDTTIDTGKEYFKKAIQTIFPDITAVVAVNDATALGVIDEARQLKINVPGDIAVAGFDDVAWSTLSYPPLTTVHSFLEEMGKLTISRILDLVENPGIHPAKSIVATKMIIRKSCGC